MASNVQNQESIQGNSVGVNEFFVLLPGASEKDQLLDQILKYIYSTKKKIENLELELKNTKSQNSALLSELHYLTVIAPVDLEESKQRINMIIS
jgi:hypothetical protein